MKKKNGAFAQKGKCHNYDIFFIKKKIIKKKYAFKVYIYICNFQQAERINKFSYYANQVKHHNRKS